VHGHRRDGLGAERMASGRASCRGRAPSQPRLSRLHLRPRRKLHTVRRCHARSRVSYSNGEVSFWRRGSDWTPATLNTPLAPGDVLYAGRGGQRRDQVGRSRFVARHQRDQIGLETRRPGFRQLRVTGGEAAVDVATAAAGSTIRSRYPERRLHHRPPGLLPRGRGSGSPGARGVLRSRSQS